VNVSEGGL